MGSFSTKRAPYTSLQEFASDKGVQLLWNASPRVCKASSDPGRYHPPMGRSSDEADLNVHSLAALSGYAIKRGK